MTVRTTCLSLIFASVSVSSALAESGAVTSTQYVQDPQTGITYERIPRHVEVPVVEEQIRQQTRTVYTPEVVTEVRRQSRTVYTPEVEMAFEPRVHGWWNPFRQPTVAYHLVPKTTWVARTEQFETPHHITRWAPRTETVEVPHRVVRFERQTRYDLQAVNTPSPVTTPSTSPRPAVSVASNAIAQPRSALGDRTRAQTGMPVNELVPVSGPRLLGDTGSMWR